MSTINWPRLIIGGLIAALIMFLTDGFFHEKVVITDWQAVYAGLRAAEPEPHGSNMIYFAIFELGRGLISLLLYATMRTHFGAGPKTAVLAAIAGWVAFSLTGPAQFIPLGFFSTVLWLKVGAFHLLTSIIATLAGAAIYKDDGMPVKVRA
ncbi:MAG TPA: hypothetical protein VLE19_05840 [Pyrinomonadaceae bacterium]|nr:hypothetical protein [Pyrinomonadaceae bacterium]